MQPLAEKASELGGTAYLFSQGMVRQLVQDKFGYTSTEDGYCNALSLKWIKHHSRGASLFQKLDLGDPKLLKRWKSVEALQCNTKPLTGGISDTDYLAEKKIVPVVNPEYAEIVKQAPEFASTLGLITFPSNPTKLCTDIVQQHTDKGAAYKLITLSPTKLVDPKKIDHACAAYVTETMVQYFDPNFGEFTMSKYAFFTWWATYWILTYDNKFFGFKVTELYHVQ